MNFLISGGGPVGLCLALRLITINMKNISIKIYEKRKSYTRKQVVLFRDSVIHRTLPKIVVSDILKVACYSKRPQSNIEGICYNKSPNRRESVSIIISDLEKILKKHLIKHENVEFVYKEFTNIKKDINWADYIVGTDGKDSYVRKNLMKSKIIKTIDFDSCGLAMTYEDKSNTKYFIKLHPNQNVNNLKKESSEQHRKRFFRTQSDYTYFGLQLNKYEYPKLCNTKLLFKNLPIKLQSTIQEYIKFHNSVPKNIKNTMVNIFPLQISHSDVYSILKNNKIYILLGDSAIQPHFFTSFGINEGFIQVENFIRLFEKYNTLPNRIVLEYNAIMVELTQNNIDEALGSFLPYRLLLETYNNMTKSELQKIAKDEGFGKNVKYLSKKELSLILSQRLLENYNYEAFLPITV